MGGLGYEQSTEYNKEKNSVSNQFSRSNTLRISNRWDLLDHCRHNKIYRQQGIRDYWIGLFAD